MHEGLHQTIARKRAAVARGESRLEAGIDDPRQEHATRSQVHDLELELVELSAAANAGEVLRGKMEAALEEMRLLKPGSAELTLAIRAAETALWRFGIHLGNAECRSTNDECRVAGKEASDA